MIDKLLFTNRRGYSAESLINVEEGSIISPSSNVIYERNGDLVSLKDLAETYTEGGNRVFVLDDNLLGFLGLDDSSNIGRGNIIQGVGRSLWFVGNGVNGGVRIYEIGVGFRDIGGTYQEETLTVGITTVTSGSFNVRLISNDVLGSPLTIGVGVSGGETAEEVAQAIRLELLDESDVTDVFDVLGTGTSVLLRNKNYSENDLTLSLEILSNTVGVSTSTSSNTTAGSIGTSADLQSIPQVSKYNGSGWDSPNQVGLAEQEDLPILELTTEGTLGSNFEGINKGAYSVRLARERNGAVSIASGASNVVLADPTNGNSMIVYIPAIPADNSDNWFLYFTYSGQGSISKHFLFPIPIPEEELDGTLTPFFKKSGNAKAEVISAHPSDQLQRAVEIEFNDNDLLILQPFEDFFSLESCKFIAKLGNVMCGIGTGSDQTGFDVSYPNNHEAYPVDWRDWFDEVPVALSQESDMPYFWICTSKTVYIATWTGVVTDSAPVLIRKVNEQYGAIGEQACVSVDGVLYLLSKGGTIVRIQPNGQIDDNFGLKMKSAFRANLSEDTKMGWDEETNSIILIDDDIGYAYQIDNDVWSSELNPTTNPTQCLFPLNGDLYQVEYNSGFKINKWNSASSDLNWVIVTAFQLGQYGAVLKDIIELKAIVESEGNSGTITFQALKDYVSASGAETLTSYVVTSAGVKITIRDFAEAIDYEAIAMRTSGTKGGQKVHFIEIHIDLHQIPRT